MISKKVIITGSFGVGKTSLFNRFILNQFGDKYLTTIGVKVNKKVIEVDDEELTLLLWDIAGEITQDKVPTTYFLGAAGIIYVMDLSRPMTFQNLENDLNYLRNLLPDAVIKVVGNKKDLLTDEELGQALSTFAQTQPNITTSAKTGENVDELFALLGKELIVQHLA